MSNSRNKKEYWKRGVEALTRHFPDLSPRYACPLCLRGFSESQLECLSWEDVPPKSVGGKPLLLTCRDCNSTAGHELDIHAKRRQDFTNFRQGDLSTRRPARMRFDDLQINIEASWKEGKLTLEGLPQRNPPGATKAFGQRFEEYHQSGQAAPTIKLRFPVRYSEQRARISLLRAAYLAAFATLGYRYALRPVLKVVRKQVTCPDTKVIRYFSFTVPQNYSSGQNVILVRQPDWAKGIAVQLESRLYLLPLLDEDNNYYERLAEMKSAGQTIDFSGKLFGWPRYPEYILDFAKSDEI